MDLSVSLDIVFAISSGVVVLDNALVISVFAYVVVLSVFNYIAVVLSLGVVVPGNALLRLVLCVSR